jgi:hypothetical protein
MDPKHFVEDILSDADEDEGDMSDENIPEPVKPMLVTNLEPLACQNNDCGGPLKVPIKQVLFFI